MRSRRSLVDSRGHSPTSEEERESDQERRNGHASPSVKPQASATAV